MGSRTRINPPNEHRIRLVRVLSLVSLRHLQAQSSSLIPPIESLHRLLSVAWVFGTLDVSVCVCASSDSSQLQVGDGFLQKIGITKEQAQMWATQEDPLENDEAYKAFVKLTGVGVPQRSIEAKMLRDGVREDKV